MLSFDLLEISKSQMSIVHHELKIPEDGTEKHNCPYHQWKVGNNEYNDLSRKSNNYKINISVVSRMSHFSHLECFSALDFSRLNQQLM